jgi:signal transduction histidine kinase
MYLPMVISAAGTTFTLSPYVLLSLLPALVAAELALYGWHRRQMTVAIPFILLMMAVCFWSACHSLSVAGDTLTTTLFWSQLQYGGIVLVAPLWLLFAIAYHRRQAPLQPAQRYVLFLPAFLSYAAVLTNSEHQLWWPTIALDRSRPFGSLQITHGILFWLHFAYSYSCIGLGFVLVIQRIRTTVSLQRRQSQLVVCGALFPIVGNVAHVLGVRTTAIDDPTPFLFVATGLVIVYAALRYEFPDTTPVAPETLFAQFPDGLVVLDHTGIVTAITAPVSRLLHLAQESHTWIGRPLRHSIAGSPLEHNLSAVLASPDADGTHQIRSQQESDSRTLEVRLRPLYAERNHAETTRVGMLLLIRDWIDQAQQQRDQQLRELTALSRFFAATTHELRTPLTALLGFTDLLNRGVYGELPERIHEPLHAMHRNGQTMLSLINDVLDIAKLKAGQFTVECSPVDIMSIIQDVVNAMVPLIQEQELAFKLDLAPEVPLVYAHPERLAQVLTNLLSNAIKFTTEGSITVQTSLAGQRVRFHVIDTGVGIAPEQQQVIFEEFKQLENARRHTVGTGLGLPISRRLMELMGGTLTVESIPGVGSIFTGELSMAQEQLQTKARGATPY